MADRCRYVRWLMLRFTQRISWLLFLSVASFLSVSADDTQKVAFYVQLIRGSDSAKPEDPAWKPVGAKLDKSLRGVFRWKNYWEVKRQTVVLGRGEIRRFHLTPDREVEIKLIDPPNTQIRLYYKGELKRCSHQPIREHISILGGESKSGECWFVVVRSDKPTDPD